MYRRSWLIAALLASTSLSALAQEKPVTVVYVGGWDCGPCLVWKKNKKADWLASPQFTKVTFVEIESPRLREAYRDQYWPDKYKPIRDQLKNKWGTPRFIVVKDGKVVADEWGSGEWDRAWSKIKEVVG